MNIRDYSSQFTVYVYTPNVDLGAPVKVHLSQASYDAFYFQDKEVFDQRIRENAPHLVVFFTEGMSGILNDFVSEIRAVNDDIKFVVVSSAEQFKTLAQYNQLGFVDVISVEAVALEERVVWAVDRASEKLYLTYQNEQLFDDLQEVTKKADQLEAEVIKGAASAEHKKPPGPSVPMRITDYRTSVSKEEIVQKYLSYLGSSFCIFFKFLPSLRSFVATHGNGLSGSDIKGVGLQLETDELRDLGSQLAIGLLPARFSEMLVAAFQLSPPKALPLYTHNHLEGVFVYSGNMNAGEIKNMSEEFSLMSLCYSIFSLEKKIDSLEVRDQVTELFNRSYYHKVLSDEVARSRRLKQPVAVVKVALDNFYELESALGEVVRDELLKSVATVVAKTSRTNDVTCRTATNEIAMILPHSSKKGAALRAERLRRIIEGTSFIDNGMKLSVSLGISEFPSLCDSAQTLDETSSKALMHILDKGGNKICLYKASENHEPEYEVTAD